MNKVINQAVLGFDFGLKYIGVAIGQTITKTASPLKIIPAENGIPDWIVIENLLKEWNPSFCVLGLPLNMQGEEQLISFCARKFAKRLTNKFGLCVHLVDERLSSWEAKQRLNITAKFPTAKEIIKINQLSAVIILEQWFNDNP
ncbi:MAG: Holliday junction helicase RuvA [Francisellaceae bacterium]|nr:Holliday junction helicase RuvA [Francisellaceae bacterium]